MPCLEFGSGQSCDLFGLSWDTSFMSWDTLYVGGILFDVVTHAAEHKHENEVE